MGASTNIPTSRVKDRQLKGLSVLPILHFLENKTFTMMCYLGSICRRVCEVGGGGGEEHVIYCL